MHCHAVFVLDVHCYFVSMEKNNCLLLILYMKNRYNSKTMFPLHISCTRRGRAVERSVANSAVVAVQVQTHSRRRPVLQVNPPVSGVGSQVLKVSRSPQRLLRLDLRLVRIAEGSGRPRRNGRIVVDLDSGRHLARVRTLGQFLQN
jgi:hypothetical protein